LQHLKLLLTGLNQSFSYQTGYFWPVYVAPLEGAVRAIGDRPSRQTGVATLPYFNLGLGLGLLTCSP